MELRAKKFTFHRQPPPVIVPVLTSHLDRVLPKRPDAFTVSVKAARTITWLATEYLFPAVQTRVANSLRRLAATDTVPHGQELQPSVRR